MVLLQMFCNRKNFFEFMPKDMGYINSNNGAIAFFRIFTSTTSPKLFFAPNSICAPPSTALFLQHVLGALVYVATLVELYKRARDG